MMNKQKTQEEFPEIEIEDTDFEADIEPQPQTNAQTKKIEIEEDTSPAPSAPKNFHDEHWFGKEGELAIDVYQTAKDIVIQTAVAGVKPEDLDIQIENDVVTIRGARVNPVEHEEKEYFHQECFWGVFSRQVFLPEEIDVKNVEASSKEGVLTIRLPKMAREATRKVKIAKK